MKDWIKRNLYFLAGGAVALALMGMAGWFLYSKWRLNNEAWDRLNQDYSELTSLNSANPHPGAGQVDNVALARKQEEELRATIRKLRTQFQPIPLIPNVEGTNITDRDFSAALSRTIAQLQREATNSGVRIPDKYSFSFEAQQRRVTFAAGSLVPLATQLGEVKAICDILIDAKVNSIDSIRRERVSADDKTGQVTDYHDKHSETNELAVLSPYEVTFRAFSAELAKVLSGFAASPHGVLVKGINVEPVPGQPAAMETQPVQPIYVMPQQVGTPGSGTEAGAEARMRSRYGIGPRGAGASRYGGPAVTPPPQPAYAPQPMAAAPAPRSNQPVLDEKQLKVTLTVSVIKLLPKEDEVAAKE